MWQPLFCNREISDSRSVTYVVYKDKVKCKGGFRNEYKDIGCGAECRPGIFPQR